MEPVLNLVKLDLKQRIDILNLFAMSSNMTLVSHEMSDVPKFEKLTFEIDGRIIEIHAILKNIVNSGWADKPFIKRIQISSIKDENVHRNENGTYSMLIGFTYIDDEPYIAVWNPFRFKFHNTVRSCYVDTETLLDAKKIHKGFYPTICSKKDLIICDKNHFKDLIEEYIRKHDIG